MRDKAWWTEQLRWWRSKAQWGELTNRPDTVRRATEATEICMRQIARILRGEH